MKPYNLEGQRFGRLTAIEICGRSKSKKVLWRCSCDCGNETIVSSCHLMSGHTKSCGCYASERAKTLAKETRVTHGQRNTRLYNIWSSMIERCTLKKQKAYHNYGGRGITVCEEWKTFENFYNWAIENGYSDELTLDRIDNDGNYCPDNCKWSTYKEQARNRRTNIYITYNEETKILRDWENYLGMKNGTLSDRINRRGWSIEKAFTTPVRKRTKKNCIDNKNGG